MPKVYVYNFALLCAFFKIGSNFVAFITSPLIFSLPFMNKFCAFALPEYSCAKSLSERFSVTAAVSAHTAPSNAQQPVSIARDEDLPLAFFFSGAEPFPTVPVSLRSTYHSLLSPSLFLMLKAKMAPPFFMASLRSLSSERAAAMSSKAAEEGQASVAGGGTISLNHYTIHGVEQSETRKRLRVVFVPSLRDIVLATPAAVGAEAVVC